MQGECVCVLRVRTAGPHHARQEEAARCLLLCGRQFCRGQEWRRASPGAARSAQTPPAGTQRCCRARARARVLVSPSYALLFLAAGVAAGGQKAAQGQFLGYVWHEQLLGLVALRVGVWCMHERLRAGGVASPACTARPWCVALCAGCIACGWRSVFCVLLCMLSFLARVR